MRRERIDYRIGFSIRNTMPFLRRSFLAERRVGSYLLSATFVNACRRKNHWSFQRTIGARGIACLTLPAFAAGSFRIKTFPHERSLRRIRRKKGRGICVP